MRYTFPIPSQLDHLAFAAHLRAANVPGFLDGVTTCGDELLIDLLPDAAPLTTEQLAVLSAAVASYVYTPDPQPIRDERDRRINEVVWRYDRNAREQRLGLPLSDDLSVLDLYIQALADVPEQPGFPAVVEWPVPPFEEVSV